MFRKEYNRPSGTTVFLGAALVILLTAMIQTTAWATNGYQLIAVGSYQKGMGGATTAAPYDSMTALSNPAGMALIGNRADFNMEMFNPNRRMDLASFGGTSTEGGSRIYGVPAIGWTAPAFNREDVFFGGGMYGTAGLGVDYDAINAGAFGTADVYTAIQFWKMSPTVSAKVNDRLAVGVAINGDYQSVEIRQFFRNPTLPVPDTNAPARVALDLSRAPGTFGVGATLGAIYRVHEMVDVGFSYSTRQYFQDTEYRLPARAVQNFPQPSGTATNLSAGRYDFKLDFPQQVNLGLAVRPIKRLLVTFDVKWIDWSSTHNNVPLTGTFSLDTNGDGTYDQTLSSVAIPFGWRDQFVFATGVQYQVLDHLAVRAGFNHADAPITPEDVFNNLAFPAVVEDHLTVGWTYLFGDHWEMSGVYKKAFKNELIGKGDVPTPFVSLAGADSNAKISMDQNSFGLQISYRF